MFSTISRAFRSPLGLQFLLIFTIAYIATAGLVVVLHSGFERQQQLRNFEREIQIIESASKKSLSQTLLNQKFSDLKNQLASIVLLTNINRIELITSDSEIISFGKPSVSDDLVRHIDLISEQMHSTKVPASYNRIAKISVYISTTPNQGDTTFINLGAIDKLVLQAILLLPVILITFYFLVTRHLKKITSLNRQLRINNLSLQPFYSGSSKRENELSELLDSINTMVINLNQELQIKAEALEEIEDARSHLSIAIENASIGFCTYISSRQSMEANVHFFRQLRISEKMLKTFENPLQQFVTRIDNSHNSEQKEQIRQMLQGRIRKVQGNFHIKKFNGQEGFFHITFQSINYQDNRPDEILICSVDRTAEHNAILKNRELSQTMEDKVRQNTEHYERDLRVQQAQHRRLNQELSQAHSMIENQHKNRVLKLVTAPLKTLIHTGEFSYSQIMGAVNALEIISKTRKDTIEVAASIKSWIRQAIESKTVVFSPPPRLTLPHSLIISCKPDIIEFILNQLIKIPQKKPKNSTKIENLIVESRLKNENFELILEYNWPEEIQSDRILDDWEYSLSLCKHTLSSEFSGTLTVKPTKPEDIKKISIVICIPLESL